MVELREGVPDDLDWLIAEEAKAYDAEFVGQEPRWVHEQMMADDGTRYFIVEDGGERAGSLIVRGIGSPDRVIEIRRIVMATPGRGHGRAALREILRRAFDEWRAHRVWLDVYPENARARHVYESLGFVVEGTLRDCVFLNGRHRSLIVLSMLEDEYRAAKPGPPTRY